MTVPTLGTVRLVEAGVASVPVLGLALVVVSGSPRYSPPVVDCGGGRIVLFDQSVQLLDDVVVHAYCFLCGTVAAYCFIPHCLLRVVCLFVVGDVRIVVAAFVVAGWLVGRGGFQVFDMDVPVPFSLPIAYIYRGLLPGK